LKEELTLSIGWDTVLGLVWVIVVRAVIVESELAQESCIQVLQTYSNLKESIIVKGM
jgi:hypothetical protein